MKNFGTIGLAAASLFAIAAFEQGSQVIASAGGPPEASNAPYRVLAPLRAAISCCSLSSAPTASRRAKPRSSLSTKESSPAKSKSLKPAASRASSVPA